MNSIKCVIFGDRHTIERGEFLDEFELLIQFLNTKNIKVVILSNDYTEERNSLRQELKARNPYIDWRIDEHPKKPKAAATSSILEEFNFDSNEVIFVGSSNNDMKTAVNGKLLFLNSTWYSQSNSYGFQFSSPKKIARFIDIFCLREYLWSYAIEDGESNLRYYSLGIYGTQELKYSYSHDARSAAKATVDQRHTEFWIHYLLSTIYLTGLHKEIDYITSYPGHRKESASTPMMIKTIDIFAKCFQKKYLPDLIIRHTQSQKSSFARTDGILIDHSNQLNTIKINKYPLKSLDNSNNRCAKYPITSEKTVLVIDDFCTEGYSLETARVYIEQTGGKVILLSLLKTIIKSYSKIKEIKDFNPFEENKFIWAQDFSSTPYRFNGYIKHPDACKEISSKLAEYDSWDW